MLLVVRLTFFTFQEHLLEYRFDSTDHFTVVTGLVSSKIGFGVLLESGDRTTPVPNDFQIVVSLLSVVKW